MAQMQQMQRDFSCFADPMLQPGEGTITVGYSCACVSVLTAACKCATLAVSLCARTTPALVSVPTAACKYVSSTHT